MFDSDDDDEKSENQILNTKADLLIECISEKGLPRDEDQLSIGRLVIKSLKVLETLLGHIFQHLIQAF